MRFQLLLGASALAILAGCTTSVFPSGEAADAEVSTTATAVVVVEGTSSGAGDGSHTEAVARFVRARSGSVDDDALRMVGANVEVPAMGACTSLGPSRVPAGRAIALLDVGSVTLFAGEAATSLQRRQLPDVADLVSGVVYSARAEGLPSKSAYLLRIDGAPESDVAPVVVSATSPGEPTEVRIAGEDGRSGAVTLSAGAPVELTWTPGDDEDVIYVDVSPTSAAPATRCLFDDGGHATLPASAFGVIEEGTLAIHRLHREPFRTHGVDPGEVRFDFARLVTFVRR